MHIDEDHIYHGAALTQIAEHRAFTAINRFENTSARGAFRINASTGIYLKYASWPTERYREYVFTFDKKNLTELDALKPQCTKLFVAMVCVRAKEICCIDVEELEAHIERRRNALGRREPQYQILVTARHGESFRVYVNAARKKHTSMEQQIVSRSRFPRVLFDNARSN